MKFFVGQLAHQFKGTKSTGFEAHKFVKAADVKMEIPVLVGSLKSAP